MYEPNNIKKWTLPDSYFGDEYPDCYVFLGRNRDSDILTQSNFETALRRIGGESSTVKIIRATHWACGWIEWISIHQDDKKALYKADEIMEQLEDYPILDDSDFTERETTEANEVWKLCYSNKHRLEHMRKNRDYMDFNDWRDMIACARGNYYVGDASMILN